MQNAQKFSKRIFPKFQISRTNIYNYFEFGVKPFCNTTADLEARSQISSQSQNVSNTTYYPPENNLTDDQALHIPPNRNNSISSEISQMKGEALNASSSIRDLQNVFSYV